MMMTSRSAILGLVRMGREVWRSVAFGTRCWAVNSGGEGGRKRKWFLQVRRGHLAAGFGVAPEAGCMHEMKPAAGKINP